jgi:hypothetical protein
MELIAGQPELAINLLARSPAHDPLSVPELLLSDASHGSCVGFTPPGVAQSALQHQALP